MQSHAEPELTMSAPTSASFVILSIALLASACGQPTKAPPPTAQHGPPAGEADGADEPNQPEPAMSAEETPDRARLPPLSASRVEMHAPLSAFVHDAWREAANIPAERREALERIAKWIAKRRSAGQSAGLLFICTHNSRRSHMGQLWAATAAAWFGIEGVETYSGGTESTAFNPRAVAALERAGFAIDEADGDNPRYGVSFAADGPAMKAWSKKYDDPANPTEGFAAIMTCSAADKACPNVPGADLRIAVPYEDPKVADDTPGEAAKYDERATQIAAEMFYLFSRVPT
jgi:arsenate reductase